MLKYQKSILSLRGVLRKYNQTQRRLLTIITFFFGYGKSY